LSAEILDFEFKVSLQSQHPKPWCNLEKTAVSGHGCVLNHVMRVTRKTLGDHLVVFGKLTLDQGGQDECNLNTPSLTTRDYCYCILYNSII